MSHEIFKKKIREAGYCCPWAFCEAHKAWETKFLAEDLELSIRSINQWRERHRLNWIGCSKVADCMRCEVPDNAPVTVTVITTSTTSS